MKGKDMNSLLKNNNFKADKTETKCTHQKFK